ncbi:cell adhesion molecule, putative, partial [Ixodes scapularis]
MHGQGSIGDPLADVVGVRRLLPNGTLVLEPFSAQKARFHSGVFQCVASNEVGTIVSRDVHLRGESVSESQLHVLTTRVCFNLGVRVGFRVNMLVLKANSRRSLSVHPLAATPKAVGGWARYSVLSPTGELLVRNVSSSDDGISYRCQTRHRLTGKAKISDTAGRVIVNRESLPWRNGTSTRSLSFLIRLAQSIELVALFSGTHCHCLTSKRRWYKLSGGTNESREPLHQGGRFSVSGGTLSIRHAAVADSGRYLCVANNSLASEPFTVTLTVMAPLSAVVVPDEQTVDLGGSATFSCVPSGHPVTSLVWLKDGRTLRQGDPRIQVPLEDSGMYQCLVKNDQDSAQGAARLKLGFSAPTFLSVFSEQSAEPGRGVSLQCSATGSPVPRITWSLDGTSLAADPRVRSGDRVAAPNHVTSFVNISAARTEDGGLYACAASNGAGSVEHAARLNVAGPLRVRPMVPVRAVAGGPLRLDCHYAGHPVDRISWTRGGVHLPSSKRQEVLRNGSLVISEVRQYEDNGTYTCHVSGPLGQSTSGTVTVNVRVRPTIAPFSFPGGLQAGMRARLGCTVISGDPPFEFDWRKDGRPLSPELGVRAQTDAFSSDLTFASLGPRHNGNYSCVVSNAAASASHSASLVVQVRPLWVIEPGDASVLLGRDARMDCRADGYPVPTITWERENLYGSSGYSVITSGSDYEIFANGSLLVKNTREQSAGRYLCQATNGIGSGLSKLVHLKVHVGPNFDIKFRSEAVQRGGPARLRCEAQGDPPVTLTWAKDGQSLGPPATDQRYTFREDPTSSPRRAISILEISSVERRDAALFTCRASNAYGGDDLNIKLIVQGLVTQGRGAKPLSMKTTLLWSGELETDSKATSFHFSFNSKTLQRPSANMSVGGGNVWAAVRPLRPAVAYRCQVRAENEVGIGEPSEAAQVTTGIEVPGGPPLEVKATAVDSQTVRVTWKPPERDLWHGELKGYYVGYRLDQRGDPYLYKTLQLGSGQEGPHIPEEVLLSPLRKFSPYVVLVQAFNAAGPGPRSDEVSVSTMDDVPSQAPQEVQCAALSSESIRVTWQPPPKDAIHGYLQGYRIWYAQLPASRGEWGCREEKAVTGQETTLVDLRKYANYFIQVAAFTQRGLGTESEPVFCRTLEDVPDSPEDVKVLIVSATSLLVAWKPPVHRNGLITMYSIYAKTLDKRVRTELPFIPLLLSHTPLEYNLTLVPRNARVEVWVTASSRVGEGPPSKIVAQTTSDQGERQLRFAATGSCSSRVTPTFFFFCVVLLAIFFFNVRTVLSKSDRTELGADGSLALRRIEAADAGNYTCNVRNKLATDRRHVALIVRGQHRP